jgi:hypothetical protein
MGRNNRKGKGKANVQIAGVEEPTKNDTEAAAAPMEAAPCIVNDDASTSAAATKCKAARAVAEAAKAAANRVFVSATCRKDYGRAAAAYAEAIQAGLSAGLTKTEDGDLLGALWSNEAFALMRSGDYSKAETLCRACLDCGSTLSQAVREKAEKRLQLAKAGLRLLRGHMGRCTYQPGVPDSWFAQHPDSDIVRMCWGWRSELETAVRESESKRVASLIAANDFIEVRCFIECRLLLQKAASLGSLDCVKLLVEEGGGDVDGMRHDCPSTWDASRRGSGYNGCTPLYGAAQGGPVAERSYGAAGSLEGRAAVARYLLEHGADPMAKSDKPQQLTPLFMACVNNSLQIVKRRPDRCHP